MSKKIKPGAEVRIRRNDGSEYSARVHSTFDNHGPWVRVTDAPKGTRNPPLFSVRPARVTVV